MKKYTLEIGQAVTLGLSQPFACITRLSEVSVGPTPAECPLEELLDARFFGPRLEVHIWSGDDGFQAVCAEDDGQGDYLEVHRDIRDLRFGKKLTLRQYLDYDEDGQAYICTTALADWKGDSK